MVLWVQGRGERKNIKQGVKSMRQKGERNSKSEWFSKKAIFKPRLWTKQRMLLKMLSLQATLPSKRNELPLQ